MRRCLYCKYFLCYYFYVKKYYSHSKKGSIVIWSIIGVLLIGIVIFTVIYNKIFLVTSGIDKPQINSYKNVLDKANTVKLQMEKNSESLKNQLNFSR